ncbi:zinc knuckle-domain-containing protein [Xylariaceae sp. FL0804]|nr:zinc knuckle-domain-containing protein [Xylariaceae sp. FL0804]
MWRRGPSKATPANVQCQKCLKRGHYSYECKAAAQERPYVPRPSRTQQLFNPKLVPKLSSDVPAPLEKTKGVAAAELAKREAEAAKRRGLDRDGDGVDDDASRRRRSASYDSVSTISTRSPSPPRARRSPGSVSPARGRAYRDESPVARPPRQLSYDSTSDHARRYSPSPPRPARGHSPSEAPGSSKARSRSRYSNSGSGRYSARDESLDRRSFRGRPARYSQSPSRSPPPERRRDYRSRSPERPRHHQSSPRQHRGHRDGRADSGRGPTHGGNIEPRREPPKREVRERSLSPFSKRLALTQSMNMGR